MKGAEHRDGERDPSSSDIQCVCVCVCLCMPCGNDIFSVAWASYTYTFITFDECSVLSMQKLSLLLGSIWREKLIDLSQLLNLTGKMKDLFFTQKEIASYREGFQISAGSRNFSFLRQATEYIGTDWDFLRVTYLRKEESWVFCQREPSFIFVSFSSVLPSKGQKYNRSIFHNWKLHLKVRTSLFALCALKASLIRFCVAVIYRARGRREDHTSKEAIMSRWNLPTHSIQNCQICTLCPPPLPLHWQQTSQWTGWGEKTCLHQEQDGQTSFLLSSSQNRSTHSTVMLDLMARSLIKKHSDFPKRLCKE